MSRALLLLCLLVGCKEGGSAASPLDSARPEAAGQSEAARAAPPAAEARKAEAGKRVRAMHPPPRVKSVTPGVPGVLPDQALAAEPVVLSRGQELVLDFSAGARVRVLGPSTLRHAAAEHDALLVRDATLTVDLAPAAGTPDSGLLLTTPSATFALVRSGRFALRSLKNGSCVAFVVSGTVSVRSAVEARESSASEGPKPLNPGDRVEVRLDGSIVRTRHAAQTLEEAEKAAAALPELKAKEGALALLDQSCSAALDALRAALLRERELSVAHRAALAGPTSQDAQRMALQEQLADHAATVSRARKRLETALAQRAASRLGTPPGADDRLSAEALGLLHPSP